MFDLARDIDVHTQSQSDASERAAAGVTGGLIGLGETVTWKARHFGAVGTSLVADPTTQQWSCFSTVSACLNHLMLRPSVLLGATTSRTSSI